MRSAIFARDQCVAFSGADSNIATTAMRVPTMTSAVAGIGSALPFLIGQDQLGFRTSNGGR